MSKIIFIKDFKGYAAFGSGIMTYFIGDICEYRKNWDYDVYFTLNGVLFRHDINKIFKDSYTLLSEYREQQINSILDE